MDKSIRLTAGRRFGNLAGVMLREMQRMEKYPPQTGDEEPAESTPPKGAVAAAGPGKKKAKARRVQKASCVLVSDCRRFAILRSLP
jgi:hypothetical protein